MYMRADWNIHLSFTMQRWKTRFKVCFLVASRQLLGLPDSVAQLTWHVRYKEGIHSNRCDIVYYAEKIPGKTVNKVVISCQLLLKRTDGDTTKECFVINANNYLWTVCWTDHFSGKWMYPNLVLKWTIIQKKKAWVSYKWQTRIYWSRIYLNPPHSILKAFSIIFTKMEVWYYLSKTMLI